jgi:hypothetical protein
MQRGSQNLGKITGQHSRPQFHLSLLGSLTSYGRGGSWWQKWERLKSRGEQGSHNKPIGCGASGAYAPGPDDEEEEEQTLARYGSVFHLGNLHVHNGFPGTELLLITYAYGQQWPYLGCTSTETNQVITEGVACTTLVH